MKLLIETNDLCNRLLFLQNLIQKRGPLPILSHVLLETRNNLVYFTATDLETTITSQCACSVDNDGAVVIPGKPLLELVKLLNDKLTSIICENGKSIQIRSGKTELKLPVLSAENFPKTKWETNWKFSKINSRIFNTAIQKTLYCTANDEIRRALCGVYIKAIPETNFKFSFVSTDGRRLSRCRIMLDQFFLKNPVLLPKKGLSELSKILEEYSMDASHCFDWAITEKQTLINTDKVSIQLTLLEGSFPDYQRVIPLTSAKFASIHRAALLVSVKRVSSLTSDKKQNITLFFHPDEMRVFSADAENGEISDVLPISYKGEPAEISMSLSFLLEALTFIVNSDITIRFTDKYAPVIISGESEGSQLCLIMPLRN